jgi:hypothetical protein
MEVYHYLNVTLLFAFHTKYPHRVCARVEADVPRLLLCIAKVRCYSERVGLTFFARAGKT